MQISVFHFERVEKKFCKQANEHKKGTSENKNIVLSQYFAHLKLSF